MSDHSAAHGHPAPSFSAKSLGRLQIFHPISLLLLIASFAVTSVVLHPSLTQVAKRHPTFFNPNDQWLLGYWALLMLLQVGTALSLALASGDRTKALLTNGLSVSVPIANIALAIWAPVFIMDTRPAHVAAEVFLGIATVFTLWSTLVTGIKQAYSPTWRRPVEWLLVHLPLRMFLAVLLHADIWQQGLIAFNLANLPSDLKCTIWPSFIIIVSVGVASALWIFATTDVAFGAAGIFIQLSILFHPRITLNNNRPTEVFAASILSIVLQGIALFASLAWRRISTRNEGRIALPIHSQEEEAVNQAEYEARVAEDRARRRRHEAERVREEAHSEDAASSSARSSVEEPTPSQLERGEHAPRGQASNEPGVTRKLGSSSGGH